MVVLMDKNRQEAGVSAGFGLAMKSFSYALPLTSSPSDNLESRTLEQLAIEKLNPHQNLELSDGLGLIRKNLFITKPSSSHYAFPALRIEGGQEVSPLSEVSTDSQSTPSSNTSRMGFESPLGNHTSRIGLESPPAGCHFQWADNGSRLETSTSMDGECKDDNRLENRTGAEIVVASRSLDPERGKLVDSKILRRLAQNREAARKSRLRKKAYVQQLESSRVKFNQLEQELERVRQQGMYIGSSAGGDHNHPGVAAFDMDHGRWVEEQNRQLSDLRSALAAHINDSDLRVFVDNIVSHYDELFRLKSIAVKTDVFHIVSGMWRTPAERCFMWMGGFRPSELLKILIPQLEPLTEQQLLDVCNLQQSSQQAEDALSQGMEALQQNLADTLATGSLGTPNVANYMGQMAMAMGKLGTLESFVRQADNLRQQTLQRMNRILTTRQAARGLVAMGDYFSRLRALSSLWVARPRE